MSNSNIGIIQGDEEQYNDSGTGAINFTVNPGSPFRLLSASLHLDGSPVTAGRLIMNTVSSAGAQFNTIFDDQEMLDVPDFYNDEYNQLDFDVLSGVTFTYPNPDGLTYGLEVKIKGE